MAIPQLTASSGGGTALLLDYRPLNESNRMTEVVSLLKTRKCHVERLVFDRFNPGRFRGRFLYELSRLRPQRVIVDISTMSKLATMLVLSACEEFNQELNICYAEARRYGPTKDEFLDAKRRKQLHRPSSEVYTGVHGVVRVESLASVAMQGQPTAALAFMSFNNALTQALLNTVFPARLFLINGRPPIHGWREGAMAWVHETLRDEWRDDNPLSELRGKSGQLPTRVTSTLDYRETVSVLLELYWGLSSSHRILLAPTGSKMQTVGCCIVKAAHPDIHIEYPSAEGFTPDYSVGVGKAWCIRTDSLADLIGRVRDFERHKWFGITG